LIRQRTQLINALRAHLAEFGLVAETGREGLAQLAAIIADESNHQAVRSAMKQALQAIVDQLAALELQIGTLDRAIHAHHRANDMSCRLETVPGIGVIGATAIASTVTDPSDFKSGRDFAAWIGLVPRQHSTGGKERLGGISKQGDRYLRRLLVIGATAVSTRPAAPAKASLDHEAAGQEAGQARCRGGCQQNGPHRVGDHGQGRTLSSTGACHSRLKRLGNGSVRRRRSKTIELRG
jgi:transposase